MTTFKDGSSYLNLRKVQNWIMVHFHIETHINSSSDNPPNDNPPNSYKRQSADKTIGRHEYPPKIITTSFSTVFTHASWFFY